MVAGCWQDELAIQKILNQNQALNALGSNFLVEEGVVDVIRPVMEAEASLDEP